MVVENITLFANKNAFNKASKQQLSTALTSPTPNRSHDLNNTLSLLGAFNKANLIPFTGHAFFHTAPVQIPTEVRTIGLLYGKPLSENLRKEFQSAAINKIQTKPGWNIPDPKVWMITAETSTFMKTGGLGNVAVDLSKAFNTEFKNDKNKAMTIVKPLYLNKTNKLEFNKDTSTYTYKTRNSEIKLKRVTSFEVPLYQQDSGDKFSKQNEIVTIYTGKLDKDNTEYIFLRNDFHFDVSPGENNPEGRHAPYTVNKYDVDEPERFAFFSKAAVYAAKKLLKDQNKAEKGSGESLITPPNVLVVNDWHASAIPAVIQYGLKANLETNKFSKTTDKNAEERVVNQLNNMPVLMMAHNLAYQGWEYNKAGKIMNLLFDLNAKEVYNNAQSYHGDVNSQTSDLLKEKTSLIRGTFNMANMGVNLSDMVIPVSDAYAEELQKTSLGYDFQQLLKTRAENKNLIGIVNGIDTEPITPNKKFINRLNKEFDTTFKPYNNENFKQVRAENKATLIDLLSKAIKKGDNAFKDIELYDSKNINLPSSKDPELAKTPIISIVSRLVHQKGFDFVAKACEDLVEHAEKNKLPKPIIVISGQGAPEIAQELKDMKDRLNKKGIGNTVVFFDNKEFNRNLADAIQMCSDFFLIPSKFEPCGLVQMEAMTKGAIPVATAVGGLKSTINDPEFTPAKPQTGYLSDYRIVSDDAIEIYKEKTYQRNMQNFSDKLKLAYNDFMKDSNKVDEVALNGFKQDWSWESEGGSLEKYINIFKTGTIKGQLKQEIQTA